MMTEQAIGLLAGAAPSVTIRVAEIATYVGVGSHLGIENQFISSVYKTGFGETVH